MRKRILSLGLSIAILASASAGLGFAARASETAGEGMTEEQMQIETEPEEELPAEGLPAEITFPVFVEAAAPAEIYTAADIFVNPTYEDNYPTTNLEAQACGTPVVTYDTGGSPESVPPENVVPVGDLGALAARIKELSA